MAHGTTTFMLYLSFQMIIDLQSYSPNHQPNANQ
jgi:hypothetical protein